jgi:hypothetical protein
LNGNFPRSSNGFAGISFLAALVLTAALLTSGTAFTQSNTDDSWQKHFEEVRQSLPPRSALPPLLDLSAPGAEAKARESAAGRAWERMWTGSMLSREIADPGVGPQIGPTSISRQFLDYAGQTPALPVRGSEVIALAEPISSSAHIAYTNRLVYSTFILKLLMVLKGQGENGIEPGDRIQIAEIGGTIRFRSGHLETFIRMHEGFVSVGKQYFFFLWKPIRSDKTFMTSEAWLVDGDSLFSVNNRGGNPAYDKGIPLKDFEAKVKVAIAKNENPNL